MTLSELVKHKPSEIAQMALDDLAKIESGGAVLFGLPAKIEMNQWVDIRPTECAVCLAGACLAMRMDWKGTFYRSHRGLDAIASALNEFRMGDGQYFLMELKVAGCEFDYDLTDVIRFPQADHSYNNDPAAWRKAANQSIEWLKERGL